MPRNPIDAPRLPRRRNVAALLATIALLAGLAAGQAHGAESDARATADQPAAGATTAKPAGDDEPVCVHGCLRWGKFCNVDPRGVYKCRRRCEKFGEICE